MAIGTKIISIDFETADKVITNDDLTKILDTSDEWIVTRTGIKKRRIIEGNTTSVDLGISAAKKAVKRCNFNPLDIDLIISACSAPEDIYPSTACLIQKALGAKNSACFDLRAACAGFIYSLNTANAFIKSGIYKNILIVATDCTTKFTDWNDRSSCVLFGDGAGAAIVTASNDDDIIAIELMAEGDCADYITLKVQRDSCPLVQPTEKTSNGFINMKGRDVYKYVMMKIPNKIEELLAKTNTKKEDIDYFIPHQSNQRMIEALAQRLEFDEDKVISNIENYGNMSAASILAALREGVDSGKIKLPAKFVLSAFGAGMTSANAIIKLDKI
ncbi:MAG: ketoacyl-ACP synthase III [Candidatus Gastranaerophilales bacterium]|nr:ketoacyl-ACP synthase III [Candidatus Gastranaerophilales bacterium]